MTGKRIIGFLFIITLLFGLTGCWGKNELNEIGIVTVTGIDREPDGQLCITVFSVQPEGTVQTSNLRTFTWIGSATGENLIDAEKNLRRTATKRLSWLHNMLVILGKEAAESEMKQVMDFFSRSREIRYSSRLLIAEGRADELMQVPADIQSNLAIELDGIIDNIEEWSKAWVSDMKELAVASEEDYPATVAGRVWYATVMKNSFSTSRQEEERLYRADMPKQVAQITGSTIIKNLEFVDFMNEKETRGYLWITGKVMQGAVINTVDAGSVSMESMYARVDSKIKTEDGKWIVDIKVEIQGTLLERSMESAYGTTEVAEEIEKKFEQEVIEEMEAALNKAQKDSKCDIFGFWKLLYRKYPDQWEQLKMDWDEIFSGLEVRLDADVTVERAGMLLRTDL